MGIQGTGLSEKNPRLSFLIIVFMGVVALGSLLYWRTQLIANSEYVQLDYKKTDKGDDSSKLKSKNFELETFDASPSIN